MARKKDRRAEAPTQDLSVHELIDGPTHVLSAEELAAGRAAEPQALATRRTVVLPTLPSAGALYRRALLGALPGVGGRRAGSLPGVELTVHGVTVDRAHLADYDRVCG